MSQTKRSPPSDRVTQSPPGVGSEPMTESDTDRKHPHNLKRVNSRQQDEPNRRRVMEHKSDALEQPFNQQSEQSIHDSDDNPARMENPTAQSGHTLAPAAEGMPEPESELEPDHDTRIARHKKKCNPNHNESIHPGLQQIARNWDIELEELKAKLGEFPSRGIIKLAIKFSSLVTLDNAWPQLKRAQDERRSRGGSAATCFPKDLQLAMKRCGLDESTDTAAQGDQPQDERLIAQSKTHDDTNRSRTKRRRKNMMIPTRGAGYSFTRSSNRDKRLKINATGSSISVVMPELPVARSDSPGPKSNVSRDSDLVLSGQLKPRRPRLSEDSRLPPTSVSHYPLYASHEFAPDVSVAKPPHLDNVTHLPIDSAENKSPKAHPHVAADDVGNASHSDLRPTLSQEDGKDGLKPPHSPGETVQHPDTGPTTDVNEGTTQNSAIVIDDHEDDCSETYDRQEVPPDVLCTLAPRTWLDDNAVFFAVWFIVNALPETFTVIDPLLSKPKSATLTAADPDIIALAPINLSDNHWALAVFHGAEQRAGVYDSMSTEDNTERIHLAIKGLIPRLFPSAVSSDWTIVNEPTAAQSNSYDCGVFLIHAALRVVCCQPLTALSMDGQLLRRLFSALQDEADDPAAWVRERVQLSSLGSFLPVPSPSQPDSVLEFLAKYQSHLQNTSQQSSQLKDLQETTLQVASMAKELYISAVRSGDTLASQVKTLEDNISKYIREPLHLSKLLSLGKTLLDPSIIRKILLESQQELTETRRSQSQCRESAKALLSLGNYATGINEAIQIHIKQLNDVKRIGDGLEELLAGFSGTSSS
ncbi:hypothetical protein EDB81DRAFT_953088 [Dactylonectria macrodidyma]|uniref:Ubiquitin-like protease family profile domain-containing protein n=1 Tax=Dactylonectria macrodidyma TaxID=307937 RepID=A0A9P9DAY8_9HYPO|nr:hypothetical protein EDB81DRAFT_953088 [Dactylonectria macrodidyma]